MKCQRCESDRIISICAKSSDRCFTTFGKYNHDGYAPCIPGVCGGDYIEPTICLECGQLQGTFPVKFDPQEFFEIDDEE